MKINIERGRDTFNVCRNMSYYTKDVRVYYYMNYLKDYMCYDNI